jgi:hypothetical protein
MRGVEGRHKRPCCGVSTGVYGTYALSERSEEERALLAFRFEVVESPQPFSALIKVI